VIRKGKERKSKLSCYAGPSYFLCYVCYGYKRNAHRGNNDSSVHHCCVVSTTVACSHPFATVVKVLFKGDRSNWDNKTGNGFLLESWTDSDPFWGTWQNILVEILYYCICKSGTILCGLISEQFDRPDQEYGQVQHWRSCLVCVTFNKHFTSIDYRYR
jgi:hypothetical protein